MEVEHATPTRSRQLAEFATDLALAGMQLVLPRTDSEQMRRLTGRTGPVWRADLEVKDEVITGSITNNQPGKTLPSEVFNQLVLEAKEILESVGRRIDAFVGCGPMSEPDQAWCDSAYWFHEALAAPLIASR
jgi:hypothetical protein